MSLDSSRLCSERRTPESARACTPHVTRTRTRTRRAPTPAPSSGPATSTPIGSACRASGVPPQHVFSRFGTFAGRVSAREFQHDRAARLVPSTYAPRLALALLLVALILAAIIGIGIGVGFPPSRPPQPVDAGGAG